MTKQQGNVDRGTCFRSPRALTFAGDLCACTGIATEGLGLLGRYTDLGDGYYLARVDGLSRI